MSTQVTHIFFVQFYITCTQLLFSVIFRAKTPDFHGISILPGQILPRFRQKTCLLTILSNKATKMKFWLEDFKNVGQKCQNHVCGTQLFAVKSQFFLILFENTQLLHTYFLICVHNSHTTPHMSYFRFQIQHTCYTHVKSCVLLCVVQDSTLVCSVKNCGQSWVFELL